MAVGHIAEIESRAEIENRAEIERILHPGL